jgi:hypothetical protein
MTFGIKWHSSDRFLRRGVCKVPRSDANRDRIGALSAPLSGSGFRSTQLGARDCRSKRTGGNQRPRLVHVIVQARGRATGGGAGNGGLLVVHRL